MSRWVYLLGAGLALVALGFVVTDALLWEPDATEANAKRIREGMTVQEASAILGKSGTVMYQCEKDQQGPLALCIWSGKAGRVTAYLDGGGRIYEVIWEPSAAAPPGPLARLRTWLGW